MKQIQLKQLKEKTSFRTKTLVLVSAVLLMFTFTRCGQTPTLSTSGTFSSVYTVLKNNNCTQCHYPGGSATVDSKTTLDFSSQATAYSSLMNSTVSATDMTGTCPSVKIVSPSNPTKSYLLAVLFSSYNTSNFAGVSGCSPYTAHQSQFNLSTSEQANIVTWIESGAQNN